jgi:hypothetical protein
VLLALVPTTIVTTNTLLFRMTGTSHMDAAVLVVKHYGVDIGTTIIGTANAAGDAAFDIMSMPDNGV